MWQIKHFPGISAEPLGDNRMAEQKGKIHHHPWKDLGISAFPIICVSPSFNFLSFEFNVI